MANCQVNLVIFSYVYSTIIYCLASLIANIKSENWAILLKLLIFNKD